MSNSARLTINGALMARPDMFAEAAFPDRLDRETLIDSIILECGNLGLFYTDPDYMTQAVKAWSRRRIRIWEEMLDTTEYEYNPIWNKDGVYRESRHDTRNRSERGSSTGESTGKTDIDYGHTIDNDETETTQVAGYNSEGWANRDKTTVDGTQKHSGTDTTNTKTNAKSDYSTGADESGDYTLERVEQGNIGVTTTQQMIKEQREVIDYDVYGIIADEFKAYFCILLY